MASCGRATPAAKATARRTEADALTEAHESTADRARSANPAGRNCYLICGIAANRHVPDNASMTTLTTSLFLAAGVCLLASSLASAQTLAGTVRDASGGRAARRDRRGVEPGAHRKDPLGRHRRHGSVPDSEPAARGLRDDVLDPGLRDAEARRRGSLRRRRHDDQRRTASGRGGGKRDGHRGNADRRRAVGAAADRAQRRSRAGAAGGARLWQLPRGAARHPGDRLQQRPRDEHQLLHGPRRPLQRGRRAD